MTVAMQTPVKVGARAWRVRFTSDEDGPYRIYRDGVHVDTTYMTQATVYAGTNEAPTIEVLDEEADEPTPFNPSRFTLSWMAVADAKEYRVEQYLAAAWTTIGRIKEDAQAAYSFVTPTQDDDGTHQFRVVPVGTNGNDGTPIAFTREMIRNPDPPVYAAALEADGTITVTAA